jgi:hypothetical protein
MSQRATLKEIEHEIRSCSVYFDWMERNRASACLSCDSTDNLQVHHIVELYHVILGLWKLYGDVDDVVAHATAMHVDDLCESVTLCKDCHKKLHPFRRTFSNQKVRIEEWAALPRHLPAPLIHHSTKASGPGLTLVTAQLLAGIGWHVLNGHLDGLIIEFKRSGMAKLLDKQPGSSFGRSTNRAIRTLKSLGIIEAYHDTGSYIELHLSRNYLNRLHALPWFISMSDVRTSKMPVFALRWFLCHQSKRRNYKISKERLVANLNLQTTTPAFVERCVKNACEDIEWAHADFDGTFFSFRLKRRGATPIWSLREMLRNAIREGS